jgi:4-amino-4-deoxy-L-arabinose transferase-like glycosyltransferase
MMPMTNVDVWVKRCLWFLAFAALLGMCRVALVKSFDPDEIESVHTGWMMLQGKTPYVDFFQHHHPLFYGCLTPVIHTFGDSAAPVMLTCRMGMWLAAIGILAATYFLAKNVFDRSTAVTAVIFLAVNGYFLQKAVEIRPDVPLTLFGTLALALMYPHARSTSSRRWATVGLCLAIAFLFLQKALFYIAAVGLIVLWRIASGEARVKSLVFVVVGAVCGILPFLIWLAASVPWDDYVINNWTLNSRFVGGFSAAKHSMLFVLSHFPLMVLVGWGTVYCLRSSSRPEKEVLLTLVVLAGLIASARAPYKQYFLPVLPFFSIVAAYGAHRLVAKRHAAAVLVVVLLVMLFEVGCHHGFYRLNVGPTNAEQLAKIQYVLDATAPTDHVYDTANVFNLFRPDLDYFWYSIEPRQLLDTYRSMRPYDYDSTELIERRLPVVVFLERVPDRHAAVLRDRYRPSNRYDDLLLRADRSEKP